MVVFQDNEEQYRSLLEDQTEVISRIRADGSFLFVNDAFCSFFGKTCEELLGKKWHPSVAPEDVAMVEAKLSTLSPAHPVVVVENRVLSGSGKLHWMQFVNRGFFGALGELREIQSVGHDISDRKKTEEALRKSEERLSLALSASHMGVWEWEVRSNAIYWSPECFDILGVDNFTGSLESFTNAMHVEDVPVVMAAAQKALADRTDFVAEFRIVRPNGEVRWLSDHGRPIYDADGTPLRLAGTVRDITDRKLSEASLSRMNEKLSHLSAHLETVREQERLAVSREIHDEIGQTITALKLDLSWVSNKIPRQNAELAGRLTEMRASLDYLIGKAQDITAKLRPPLLDNLGLEAAIEWHLRQFRRRSGIDCRFLPVEDIEPLDEQIATAAMRIFQEAMTNILRHAQATQVVISLCRCAEELVLEIEDNGSGISAEEIGSPAAYGIMGMQERARLIHGELQVIGRPGKGTTVCLTIPLQRQRAAEGEYR